MIKSLPHQEEGFLSVNGKARREGESERRMKNNVGQRHAPVAVQRSLSDTISA